MTAFEATAYGPPWDAMNGSGITSTGVSLADGKQKLVIAVDRSVLPYGTKVKIDPNPFGDPNLVFTASDTGGAIIGHHIDIFIASGRAAQNGWGVRTVNVTVVGSGSPSDIAVLGDPGSTIAKGGVAGFGGSGTALNNAPQNTYSFQVGSTDNPDEDNWTASNRLAQEVNWYLFSDGETVYYIDGADLIAQDPGPNARLDRVRDVARIKSLRPTFDNTAFQFTSTHKRKGKVQHKTRLSQVVSPTSCTLELFCGIDEFRAGDLIVLANCGPVDGRWVIGDARRSVFETFTSMTLVPPVAPIPEMAAAGTTGAASTDPNAIQNLIGGAGGLRQKVVAAATKALQREQSSGGYSYAEIRPYPSSLYGPGTVVTDCSGFATLCYKEAGAPDPNGASYDGQGFTGTLEQHGKQTSSPQPGDLAFWSSPDHVGVYVGNGNVIEFGGNPGPAEVPVSVENGYHAAFLGYRSYL